MKINRDPTSTNYPWYVTDEQGRWVKTCRSYKEAEDWIKQQKEKQ